MGDSVVLGGVLKSASGATTTIAVLPAAFRPTARRVFIVVCKASSLEACRVDIYPSGAVVLAGRTRTIYSSRFLLLEFNQSYLCLLP